jgi:hypothetical protein
MSSQPFTTCVGTTPSSPGRFVGRASGHTRLVSDGDEGLRRLLEACHQALDDARNGRDARLAEVSPNWKPYASGSAVSWTRRPVVR